MGELRDRTHAAWYALRGWSVMRGVSVTHGEVEVHHNRFLLSGGGAIRHARVFTQGPVTIRGKGAFSGNEGTALPASEHNPAGWALNGSGVVMWPGNPPPVLPVTGETESHEVRLDG